MINKPLIHWVDSQYDYIKNQTLSQGSIFKVQRSPLARDKEKGVTTDYTDFFIRKEHQARKCTNQAIILRNLYF